MGNNPAQLSHEEAERLREILMQHDKKNNAGPNSFDLHNPKVPPYRHQEFPKLVYHHENSKPSKDTAKINRDGNQEVIHTPAHLATKQVNNQDELEAALAAGYQEKPPVLKHVGLNPEEESEIDLGGEEEQESPLEGMTKPQLLAHAKDNHGLELAATLKKGDIIAAIEEAEAAKQA